MVRLRSILLLVLITLQLNAQDKREYELLRDQISRFGQAEIVFNYPGIEELSSLPLSFSISNTDGKNVWAKVSVHDLSYMLEFPYAFKVLERSGAKAVQSALSVEEAMNWDLYPTYQQYDSIMQKLARDYPELCKLDTIGESVKGRQVFVLKISDNVSDNESEPEVFFSSTMHGDELVGYVMMLRLAEHLLINSSNGGLEQQLVDSLEIWINPNANPDGTYSGGDTISSPVRVNANGEDLNRRFPDPDIDVLTPIPAAKENIDMVQFLSAHRFVISANFHSGIELVNYPWDKWSGPRYHADHNWFEKISRAYADTVHWYSSNQFYFDDYDDGVTHGATWYRINGGRQDYVTYERQGREVTVELHTDYLTDASLLPTIWNDNYRSLLNYLSNAFYGIHGTVVDYQTGEPLEARLFIQGHDIDSSHVYSEDVNGSFVRLIDEGSWNIAVFAEDYETLLLSNVQVSDFQQTRLEIRLVPDGNGVIDNIEDKIKIWPIPTSNFLNIELPVGFGNKARVSVYNVNGTLLKDEQVLVSDSSHILNWNISSLSSGIYLLKIHNSLNQKTISGRFIVR